MEVSVMVTLLSLLLAALLEVGGDAAIRRGLLGTGRLWVVLGGLALVAYGLTVNLNREIEFGRLMGVYIAVFFVASQLIGVVVFRDPPSWTMLVGGALFVLGGTVIQLGAR
jgi:drug/metabolite transporter superfamily protein YnfA